MQAVGAFYELGWHTVKSIDKARLREPVVDQSLIWLRTIHPAQATSLHHSGHRSDRTCSGSERVTRARRHQRSSSNS
ncbi:hypothetical protein CBM2634_P100033 [Cupriavidus taiwanensis]|uniref:Transposase n=1 Tax=Cupriavidus taiwanensis TaxID=164546 RepID=A0A375JAL6_9BURK|nr:hypothetical protein CBM2634_P100033 [Cupriavidus taiwanensis]